MRNNFLRSLSISLSFLLSVQCDTFRDLVRNFTLPEDGNLNFTEIVRKYGHNAEKHEVITKDGYILGVFHIPGNRGLPLFLLHGIMDSAETFVKRGNTSLAITLANAGYDVWAGNSRGNLFSRKHVTLNPEKDPKFWDFSFHEQGLYDVPSTIDYILNATGKSKVNVIAHSQGTQTIFAMGSLKPEYNKKVNLFIALSPVCFLSHLGPPVSLFVHTAPLLAAVFMGIGQYEFIGHNTSITDLIKFVCSQKEVGYEICAKGGIFPFAGWDTKELEPEFFSVIIGSFPAATSTKNALHTAQVALRKRFGWFDFGQWKNKVVYNSYTPPDYDLGKFTMKTALIVAKNDKFANLKDVATLRKMLKNVVEYIVMERVEHNHIDYIWGKHAYVYLYPKIFKLLNKYDKI